MHLMCTLCHTVHPVPHSAPCATYGMCADLCDQALELCVVGLELAGDLVELHVDVVDDGVLLIQLLLHALGHVTQGPNAALDALQLRILPHLGVLPLLQARQGAAFVDQGAAEANMSMASAVLLDWDVRILSYA